MPRLILLVAILLLLLWWWRSFNAKPAEQKRSFLITSGAYLLAAIAIAAALTGRMHWVGAALAALLAGGKTVLAVALRSAPILRLVARLRPLRPTMATSLIRVTFDLASSTVSGVLLPSESAGELAGSDVKQLTEQQYQQLWQLWQQSDRQSALLLRACRLGPAGYTQSADSSSDDGGALTVSQATQILGLSSAPSREQVVAAHRRLIQRLHPDRGGSDYLAAQINQAKQVLLDSLDNAS
ncbi:hypothetical protein E3W66_03740 [Gammaproteobacteria bacterium LSUCC0057]|uniref:J domain-containing protein n=1 Tax=Gammaproteobacteria bacterium LSUCC0057 TaxID=2559237 RepID=A0A4Y8UMM0_9GAMM|nr:hypothetical protein E3W66_03740 [Gammaproteobacteria bacterium LSUCC0057]